MKESEIYSPRVARRSTKLGIRGVEYHINEWGDAKDPLIVMLHGWGDCGGSFQFLVDALQENWFVVAPDWRGFGQSHLRAESYWFPDYVADLDRLLEIYRPDEPLRLLGHSMGANIAGLYAGIMPERVQQFVNVEGFGLADSNPADAPSNYRRWLEQGRKMPAYRTYPTFDALADRIRQRSPRLPAERANYVARLWAERLADGRIGLKADPAHKLPNATLYRRAEAAACWRQVTARTLLVLGEDTDFVAGAKSWLDDNPENHPFRDAKTETIATAGHMVHFEAPEALAAVTEAFLR